MKLEFIALMNGELLCLLWISNGEITVWISLGIIGVRKYLVELLKMDMIRDVLIVILSYFNTCVFGY